MVIPPKMFMLEKVGTGMDTRMMEALAMIVRGRETHMMERVGKLGMLFSFKLTEMMITISTF